MFNWNSLSNMFQDASILTVRRNMFNHPPLSVGIEIGAATARHLPPLRRPGLVAVGDSTVWSTVTQNEIAPILRPFPPQMKAILWGMGWWWYGEALSRL
jgi:hypothetical protein